MQVHNVRDGRRSWIGSWEAAPLAYDALGPSDVGRTVIYRDVLRQSYPMKGVAEAGTLTSWKNGTVFARYSRGDTAAGANAADLIFGIRPLDGPTLAAVIAASPMIDAPQLPAPSWHGLARHILEEVERERNRLKQEVGSQSQ